MKNVLNKLGRIAIIGAKFTAGGLAAVVSLTFCVDAANDTANLAGKGLKLTHEKEENK